MQPKLRIVHGQHQGHGLTDRAVLPQDIASIYPEVAKWRDTVTDALAVKLLHIASKVSTGHGYGIVVDKKERAAVWKGLEDAIKAGEWPTSYEFQSWVSDKTLPEIDATLDKWSHIKHTQPFGRLQNSAQRTDVVERMDEKLRDGDLIDANARFIGLPDLGM